MNILVTGANGQLGTEIRNLSEGMGHHFIFSDVSEVPGRETVYLDITNPDAIRIVCRSEDVDVIVNCAAYTDVARAEDDIDFAALLNHTVHELLVEAPDQQGVTVGRSTGHKRRYEAVGSHSSEVTATLRKYGLGSVAGSAHGGTYAGRAAADYQHVAVETAGDFEFDFTGVAAGAENQDRHERCKAE